MLHLPTAIIPGVIEVVVFEGHLLHIVTASGPENTSKNHRFFFYHPKPSLLYLLHYEHDCISR